jgi:predicted alpha/beta hydrolase
MKGVYENLQVKEVPVNTADGRGFTLYSVSPPGAPGTDTLVIFPAMGVEARYYRGFAAELAAAGFNLLLADLRGNGTWKLRPSRGDDFGYREMITYDWPAVLDTASSLFPGTKITLMGHSLGGQLSLLYMALAEKKVTDRAILISAPSVYYRG